MARGARRSSWTAAAIATVGLGVFAAGRGTLDAPMIAASLVVLCLGGVVGSLGRARIVRMPEPPGPSRHSVAEALLANIPDPVILVDRRAVVIEVNPAARALLPALKLRHPLSFALRAPDVLDGIEEVLRTGASLKTLYATRVPTERTFEVQIGALPMPDGVAGGQPNVVLFLRDLTSARRLEAMETLCADAVAQGAELRTGGKRIGNRGNFFEPTVLCDVPPSARIMNEEPFGPIAAIRRFSDDAEALTEANRLPYGLAAYAYTRSGTRANRFGAGIEAGMISINHHGIALPETPFGGVKDSGYGSEGGSEAIEAYLNTKFVTQAGL